METLWEPEVSPEEEAIPETQDEAQAEEPEETPASAAPPEMAVALSADEFSALEERILRAVALVKEEREARAAAEARATHAETALAAQVSFAEQLQKEVANLKSERDHVRERVERLLTELDALEL